MNTCCSPSPIRFGKPVEEGNTKDNTIFTQAIAILVPLYRNSGKFLLESARQFSEQLVYGVIANIKYYKNDMPIEKVKGAIAVFDLICDDGNLGVHHDFVSKLYLYLSRLQWEHEYHDDAFASLDKALEHAKAYEVLVDGNEHKLTAPLVSFVKFKAEYPKELVKHLSEDWPFWCNPDYKQVEAEIKIDPRWNEWVAKTKV